MLPRYEPILAAILNIRRVNLKQTWELVKKHKYKKNNEQNT